MCILTEKNIIRNSRKGLGKCANEIEAFRYRFLDDEVVLYDTIHTSFAYLDAETELFKFISVPMKAIWRHI